MYSSKNCVYCTGFEYTYKPDNKKDGLHSHWLICFPLFINLCFFGFNSDLSIFNPEETGPFEKRNGQGEGSQIIQPKFGF